MLKVFVADPSPPVRERLAELVSAVEGVELVGQAGTAEETIRAVQQLQPEVAILDLGIAGCDRLRVLETIATGESVPVVVVLAAFPYPQHRQKCLEAGAAYFLDKVAEFEKITQVLQGLIEAAS